MKSIYMLAYCAQTDYQQAFISWMLKMNTISSKVWLGGRRENFYAHSFLWRWGPGTYRDLINLPAGAAAKYCDECVSVCESVCLSVCSRAYLYAIFTNFCACC